MPVITLVSKNRFQDNPYEALMEGDEHTYHKASTLLIIDNSKRIWVGKRTQKPGEKTVIPPMGRGQVEDLRELSDIYNVDELLLGVMGFLTRPEEIALIEARQETGYDFFKRTDELRYAGLVADSVHRYVLHTFDIEYRGEQRKEPIPRKGVVELQGQGWRNLSDLLKETNMTPAVKAIFRAYDISSKLSHKYVFRTRV